MIDKCYNRETELLYRGHHIPGKMDEPETDALYLTSAFNVRDLDEMDFVYDGGGFAYNRTNNPNRTALADAMTYLEGGEDSIVCGCGMAAITTALMSLVKPGDHILSDMTLYGETIDFMKLVLNKFGVEVTFVDFTKLDQVEANIRPNTAVFYTETVSNPMMTVVDIRALAEISHRNSAKLVVDNTFTTSVMIRPLDLGADVVVNSLTKFYNGHSDCLAGSVTSTKAIIKGAYDLQVLLGTNCDAFTSWMVLRSIRTLDIRVKKQMEKAQEALADQKEVGGEVPKSVKPGDMVHIASMDVDAIIVAPVDSKGYVQLKVGMMKMRAPLSDLRTLTTTQQMVKKEQKKLERKKSMREARVDITTRAVRQELDVRGMALDEAIPEVEKFIDDAMLSSLGEVSIIHGNGTGVLRAGIQDCLRRHPCVSSFRLGRYGEGETGVTIVSLK